MNESCPSYEWVMSHIHVTCMNESHTWVSHVTHMKRNRVTHIWREVMSQIHTYERANIWESLPFPSIISGQWVMSHIWMSHAAHTNVSCHTYEWVMPHTWMSHVTSISGSCHTHEWVMSHTCISHATHMNESCYAHMNDSCHTYMSHMIHVTHTYHIYEWVPYSRESCHTHRREVTSQMYHVTHMKRSHVTHIKRSHVTHMKRGHVTHIKEKSRHRCMRTSRFNTMKYTYMSYIWVTTDLENLLPLSPLSNLGTAFSFHTSQGLPRHDMQPSSMPPGLGNAPVFYAHTAAGDPSNGTGSLISRDWQDAPSLATTLKLSRRGFPAVRSLGAGTSLGSRLGMGMLQACDEKVPSRRLEASGKNFSSLLTVKDSTSIVPHTEPRCDFDDSRLDVGPGNPWDVC